MERKRKPGSGWVGLEQRQTPGGGWVGVCAMAGYRDEMRGGSGCWRYSDAPDGCGETNGDTRHETNETCDALDEGTRRDTHLGARMRFYS